MRKTERIEVRVSEDTVEQIEELVENMNGVNSRSEVIRDLIKKEYNEKWLFDAVRFGRELAESETERDEDEYIFDIKEALSK